MREGGRGAALGLGCRRRLGSEGLLVLVGSRRAVVLGTDRREVEGEGVLDSKSEDEVKEEDEQEVGSTEGTQGIRNEDELLELRSKG